MTTTTTSVPPTLSLQPPKDRRRRRSSTWEPPLFGDRVRRPSAPPGTSGPVVFSPVGGGMDAGRSSITCRVVLIIRADCWSQQQKSVLGARSAHILWKMHGLRRPWLAPLQFSCGHRCWRGQEVRGGDTRTRTDESPAASSRAWAVSSRAATSFFARSLVSRWTNKQDMTEFVNQR